MITSITVAWTGGVLIVISSFSFVRVLQLKIQGWNRERLSPLPLEGFYSITSWVGILAGLTIMFTGVLETFTFSPLKSLIASLILAFTTGLPMWGVVKSLLEDVESGTLKPMEPGQF
ncbi:hypothetical protein [Prochlorococcus sp. MIT 1307]|uniref:hypothetical protein n=1 Tax=Prochlorococcus sp. MIT 1307 TaxID=3096219 RepID=UPI002A76329C|nr:hypothetical protein [Prochlorococcus sp. MIT 1307]